MTIVWLLWFAGIIAVIIGNLQPRGTPQPPLVVLKPTPSPAHSPPAGATVSPSPAANTKQRMIWQVNTTELKDLATSIGIMVGGLWAYFKFFKGRTFHARLEPKVTARIVDQETPKTLIVSMELTNVGLGVVYLNPLTSVDVYATRLATPNKLSGVKWGDDPKTFRVFTNHSWIEPDETIRDEIMLRLSNADKLSYRLILVVRSEGRTITKRWRSWQKRRKLGGKWTSSCVAQNEPAQSESHNNIKLK